MSLLTSLETIKKLIAYAEAKRRLKDPEEVAMQGDSPMKLGRKLRQLRKELLNAGIGEELLNLSGDDIALTIYSSIAH